MKYELIDGTYVLERGFPKNPDDIAVIRHENCLVPVDLKTMERLHICIEFDGDGILTLRKIRNNKDRKKNQNVGFLKYDKIKKGENNG